TVTLLGGAKGIGDRSGRVDYYYLPTGLRLSPGADGRPQFLFLKYNTEAGDVQGGVLHFLMEWGLTQSQLAEAKDKLADVCKSGVGFRKLDAPKLKKIQNDQLAGIRADVTEKLGPARRMRSKVFGLWPVMGDIPCGTIKGAARVTTQGDGESFRVISATLSSDAMTRSLVSSGKAPVLPGNRIAVAADMNANGAQLLAAPFERDMPIGDLSLELDLAFTSRVPAGEGRIVMHWDRLAEDGEDLEREWNKRKAKVDTVYKRGDSKGKACSRWKKFWNPNKCDHAVPVERQQKYASDVEMRDMYSFLEEQEIIELDFRENVADERLAPVREAFFQYFLDSFAEPISAEEMAQLRNDDETVFDELEVNEGKKNYYASKTMRSVTQATKKQEFKLNYHLAYERPFSVVQNIKSWYDDVAANYPEAMADVNLNDPFFRNRTIRFRLDFDAPQELFSRGDDRNSAINYVTVQMRKQRDAPGENDFTDYVTIDESYIAEHGLFAEMTFAEGGASDVESFEYLTQWSYGGGQLYPESPRWTRSNTPAVTLAPPVAPRTIEVEGDLGAMEASDVSRITAQVLYRKFGKAFSQNIPVSPAEGRPLKSRTVFIDRDQKGYAYRLIVYLKTGDRIATDWSAKVNDDYVFAAVPSDILQNPDLLLEAKAAASDVAGQALEAVKDKVLDELAGVLGGG
ncbi:MAG: hypothetical protein ABFS14_13545, partial [Gemmatimonadota bacterium]